VHSWILSLAILETDKKNHDHFGLGGCVVPSDSHFDCDRSTLKLANGITWGIAAADQASSAIVAKLGEVMKLTANHKTPDRQVLVFAASCGEKDRIGDRSIESAFMKNPPAIFADGSKCLPPNSPLHFLEVNPSTVACLVLPAINSDMLTVQMMRIADVVARQSERHGALLLHSALAEWDGYGVILAGPSGAGKTTSSRRLPSSWQSLADDMTLVVPDGQGTYWAHPWPTWGQLMHGRWGGTWDVPRAIPVKGIFFLVQDREERAVSVGTAQAACLLANSITQPAFDAMMRRINDTRIREHYLNCFNSVSKLVRAVPCHLLHLKLRGAFWREIERIVEGITSNPSARPCPAKL
jgi:SynChlorMet cassette protein ScmC